MACLESQKGISSEKMLAGVITRVILFLSPTPGLGYFIVAKTLTSNTRLSFSCDNEFYLHEN